MNKARPFKFLRTRSLRAWISPVALSAFLFSVLISCMCGPFCGSAEAVEPADEPVMVATGCCAAHPPVQETAPNSSCCKHEPGETHCEDDLSESALQLSDSTISIAVPAAQILELILPEAADLTIRYGRAAVSAAVHIRPAYIQFQSFLL